jgi:hypothetical protein
MELTNWLELCDGVTAGTCESRSSAEFCVELPMALALIGTHWKRLASSIPLCFCMATESGSMHERVSEDRPLTRGRWLNEN